MEHLWSRAVATGGNRWQMGLPRKRLDQAKTVAMGCDQLPIGGHARERFCHRLPRVAKVPLSVKEGVESQRTETLVLLAALRARTLVAAAPGARVPNHGWILSPLRRVSRRTSATTALRLAR